MWAGPGAMNQEQLPSRHFQDVYLLQECNRKKNREQPGLGSKERVASAGRCNGEPPSLSGFTQQRPTWLPTWSDKGLAAVARGPPTSGGSGTQAACTQQHLHPSDLGLQLHTQDKVWRRPACPPLPWARRDTSVLLTFHP